jgi:uncharacterized membrane protein YqaE (UPF0057 family)
MKKNILFNLAALSVGAMLFASCSTSKQTAFSKAKYYNFGHHDPVVVINQTPNAYDKEVNDKSRQTKYAEPQLLYVKASGQEVQVEKKSVVQNIDKQVHSKPRIAGQPVEKKDVKTGCDPKTDASPAYMPVYANETAATATTSGGGSSNVDPVLLVVLAIFISPLAVYLYDNAATTRFWIDLLLWVFGVGFLGLVIFIGILWLVAVIYAILIVTGNA